MKKIASALLVLGATACGGLEGDEDSLIELGSTEQAILNGIVDQGLFPEVVRLTEIHGLDGTCSASVMTSRYLLTAAHCLLSTTAQTPVTNNRTRVKITTLGGSTTSLLPATYSVPNWNPSAGNFDSDDDVALIRLNTPIPSLVRGRFHRSPISPDADHHVVGWGRNNPGGGGGTLRWGIMGQSGWNSSGLVLSQTAMWDVLPGDSGGPSIIRRSNGATRNIITGVHSTTSPTGGTDARVVYKMPWVFAVSSSMGSQISCRSSSAEGVGYYYGCTDS